MKCVIILAFLACMTHADFLCLRGGNEVCRDNCHASGSTFGGFCDENGDCKCNTESKSQARSDNSCEKGGDATCSASCQQSGHFNGYCDRKNNCVCY